MSVFWTLCFAVTIAAAHGLSSDSRVFSAADYGALDDGVTDNTAPFSAALKALLAAGGGRLLLPRSSVGVYRGNILIPPVAQSTILTVEIAGDVSPAPVFGTVGNISLCANCSHVVVQVKLPPPQLWRLWWWWWYWCCCCCCCC